MVSDPMSRNTLYLWERGTIQTDSLCTDEIRQAVRSRIPAEGHASARRIFSLDGWSPSLEDSVDEALSSALMVQDRELASILQEVEKISASLKSEAPDTRSLSETLQRTLQCAVKRSFLERELRSLALTDDLTGLNNRRAFMALAGQQLKVARRSEQGLLLFFADVDNLKEINDTYGHQEGDLALIHAADALEHTFRDSDVIARLGGDEFAVLALEASCENRDAILRRLEKNLRESNRNESRYQLSVSVGMSRFDPNHPVPLGKLIANADEAMYEEKKSRLKLCVT
jgi:diguanylate cyclase (GGDEF)-like protein